MYVDVCVDLRDNPLPPRGLGDFCQSSGPFDRCVPDCFIGSEIGCVNNRCERLFSSAIRGLGCECDSGAQCASNICNGTIANPGVPVCLSANRPTGASCDVGNQCSSFAQFSWAACENGVCRALPLNDAEGRGTTCTAGACPAGSKCTFDSVFSTFNCTVLADAGGMCTANSQCVSGLACNRTGSGMGVPSTCVTAFSGAPGTPCGSWNELCESGYCGPRGVCSLPLHSVPDGSPCLDGDRVCRIGSRCSGDRNADANVGNVNNEPVCRSVLGLPCNKFDDGPTAAFGNDACNTLTSGGNNQCVCGTAQATCVGRQPQLSDGVCDKEAYTISQVLGTAPDGNSVIGALTNIDPTVFSTELQETIGNFICCLGCLSDDPYAFPSAEQNGAIQTTLSYKVNGCFSGAPTLELVNNQELGKCTDRTKVVPRSAAFSCPAGPAAPEKSTFEKNKTAIIAGSVGGVVFLAIVAAVVVVVLKVGGGGGAAKSTAVTA